MSGVYPVEEHQSAVAQPDLGSIIPSVKGRKIAYAIFAAVSFIVGNSVVFFSATGTTAPVWLIGLSAVIANAAPAFSAIAIANAKAE